MASHYMKPMAHRFVPDVNGLRRVEHLLFFLNIASKQHTKTSMPSIRDPDTSIVHHDPFEILGVWQSYYPTLFTAQQCDPAAQDEMLSKLTVHLSQAERDGCEGCLMLEECFDALNGMPHGKTTGSDGFPMELFLYFWQSSVLIWFVFSMLLMRLASFPPLSVEG